MWRRTCGGTHVAAHKHGTTCAHACSPASRARHALSNISAFLLRRVCLQAPHTHTYNTRIQAHAHKFKPQANLNQTAHRSVRTIATTLSHRELLYRGRLCPAPLLCRFLNTEQRTNHKTLLVWSNRPCVVMGLSQNPWVECDLAEMRRRDVWLARRKSGGGAVYHVRPGRAFRHSRGLRGLHARARCCSGHAYARIRLHTTLRLMQDDVDPDAWTGHRQCEFHFCFADSDT